MRELHVMKKSHIRFLEDGRAVTLSSCSEALLSLYQ